MQNPLSENKLESLQLQVVNHFITDNEIQGAQNSKNDVMAQVTVVLSDSFLSFVNNPLPLPILLTFFKTDQANMLKKLEPVQAVHHPWKGQTPHNYVNWKLHQDDVYTGKYGGGNRSPSN